MSKHFGNKGFTLIEILLVVVIVGILAGTVTVSLTGNIDKAKRSNISGSVQFISPFLLSAAQTNPSGVGVLCNVARSGIGGGVGAVNSNWTTTSQCTSSDLDSLSGDGICCMSDGSNWVVWGALEGTKTLLENSEKLSDGTVLFSTTKNPISFWGTWITGVVVNNASNFEINSIYTFKSIQQSGIYLKVVSDGTFGTELGCNNPDVNYLSDIDNGFEVRIDGNSYPFYLYNVISTSYLNSNNNYGNWCQIGITEPTDKLVVGVSADVEFRRDVVYDNRDFYCVDNTGNSKILNSFSIDLTTTGGSCV